MILPARAAACASGSARSKAIDFPERLCGEWMVSETRCGPMVHARLGVAAENSGKLVSTVRREARRIAEEENRSLIIVDGPPGIGCPVIASVTGASLVLVVTEPTVSGEHDLERVLSLTRHFDIPAAVCVNKWDLNAGDDGANRGQGAAGGGASGRPHPVRPRRDPGPDAGAGGRGNRGPLCRGYSTNLGQSWSVGRYERNMECIDARRFFRDGA